MRQNHLRGSQSEKISASRGFRRPTRALVLVAFLSFPAFQPTAFAAIKQLTHFSSECVYQNQTHKTLTADGSNLYFISPCDLIGENPNHIWQVYRVTIFNQVVSQTSHFLEELAPSDIKVSGDGSIIVFDRNLIEAPGPPYRRILGTITSNGAESVISSSTTSGGIGSISVSHDGRLIGYVESGTGHNNHVYVVHKDGTGLLKVLEAPSYPGTAAKISGDGSRILMVASDNLLSQLYTVNIDGSNLVRLTNDPEIAWYGSPQVSFDGQYSLFISASDPVGTNPNHTQNLFRIKTDGTEIIQITRAPEFPCAPDVYCTPYANIISSDGTRVVYNQYGTACLDSFCASLIPRNYDGSNIQNLLPTTVKPGGDLVDANEDLSVIVFSSNGDFTGENPQGAEQIFAWIDDSIPPPAPVVLVHGFTGDPDTTFGGMKQFLEQDGWPAVSYFDYSDKTPYEVRSPTVVQWSIENLAGELAKHICNNVKGGLLGQDGECSEPGQVDIVAHSMGGLIARAYIAGMAQDKANSNSRIPYDDDIRRLIMAGTPNYGAAPSFLQYLGGLESTACTVNRQACEMVFGSNFVWSLTERWRDVVLRKNRFPVSNLLAISGTNDGFTANCVEDIGDGIVGIASSALPYDEQDSFLPDIQRRYVPYRHADIPSDDCRDSGKLVYVDDNGGVNDKDTHQTFQLIREFLETGTTTPDPDREPPPSIKNNGLLLVRLVDKNTHKPVPKIITRVTAIHIDPVDAPTPYKDSKAGTFTVWPIPFESDTGQITVDVTVTPPTGYYKVPPPLTDVTIKAGRPTVRLIELERSN